MATRIVTAAAVALAVVCPAAADTRIEVRTRERDVAVDAVPAAPTIRLGTPSSQVNVFSVKLSVVSRPRHAHATLAIVLSTPVHSARDVETTIDVPRGARVVGMALTMGKAARITATALDRIEAAQRYRNIVEGRHDPALLEHVASLPDQERLSLRVFPLSKAAAATVELELELPESRTLVLTSTQQIPRVAIDVDGVSLSRPTLSEPQLIYIPEPSSTTQASEGVRAAVNTRTSLFAEEPMTRWPLIISCGMGGTAYHTVNLNKNAIRREVRLHHDQLRHCYMKEAQRKPSLAGSVMLHFNIVPSGEVTAVTVDGALPSDTVKQCMASEVAQWRFHEHDGLVQVNYPLQLKLN